MPGFCEAVRLGKGVKIGHLAGLSRGAFYHADVLLKVKPHFPI
jgi:hypothetical protein